MNENSMDTADDAALDPAAMLDLAERQQDAVQRRLAAGVPWILAAWAVTWAVGFAAFWLVEGLSPVFALDGNVAIAIFAVLWLGAIAVSIAVSVRINRGLRSTAAASWTGTVYGIAWMLTIGGIVALYFGLSRNGLDPALGELYFPSATGAGVGLLYFLGGGIWRSGLMVGMGLVIGLGALAAPFVGAPAHFLVLALSGGAAFAVGAVLTARYAQPVGMWT